MMHSNEHDISVLNTLITTTIDSADGFENSAKDAESSRFEQMFREMAQERRQVVGRLQERVRQLGGEPNDDGSLKADLHRRWEDLRSAISGGDDKAVIEEVERGEDYLKEKYETALRDDKLSPATRSLISECFESVRKGHDRASQLKHSMQETGA
ncbi:MAG: PA2169 family four-helix-bundle protein [Pseudomonadota bacterium]|nr:PA2169 family four-helix-bundle protein [Pseudomonadota bacterium]